MGRKKPDSKPVETAAKAVYDEPVGDAVTVLYDGRLGDPVTLSKAGRAVTIRSGENTVTRTEADWLLRCSCCSEPQSKAKTTPKAGVTGGEENHG